VTTERALPLAHLASAGLMSRPAKLVRTALRSRRARVAASLAFTVLMVAAAVLVARRLTHASWPLDRAQPALAAAAAVAYLASFVFRARAWHRLFPREECPDQARCLASVGAAAASGAVLPFRLDYLVKVGTLRKLAGIRIGLGAIALSIVSLGMIDAIAMLPLSISATATSGSALRGPLLIVVVFGIGCCTLLVVGGRLVRLPFLRRSRRLRVISDHVARHTTTGGRRDATVAWFYLFACWSTRAFGSAALLSALGLSFSPEIALVVICLGAAAGVIPITSGGAVVNAGAAAAILLALGVGKDIAINFSLASGLLLVTSALTASVFGVLASLAMGAAARRRLVTRAALAPIPTTRVRL
jgi:Lysylphosphatidylglycerol synthase TM region